MNKNAPIIVMKDDEYDRAMLTKIVLKLSYLNKVVFFEYGTAALAFMQDNNTNPFLILSDSNLTGLNALKSKKQAHACRELRRKSVPYVFFSTLVGAESTYREYEYAARGFLQQTAGFDYWKKSYSLTFSN